MSKNPRVCHGPLISLVSVLTLIQYHAFWCTSPSPRSAAPYPCPHLASLNPRRWAVSIPIPQMSQLRPREVEPFFHNHITLLGTSESSENLVWGYILNLAME